MKNSIKGIIFSVLLFIVAVILNFLGSGKAVGIAFMLSGVIFLISTLLLIIPYLIKFKSKTIDTRLAKEELLKNKELLDKGIITQYEYDKLAEPLKPKILIKINDIGIKNG